MKHILILTLALVTLNAYEIRFDKSFEKSILPDVLSTQISIESDKEKETEVKNELDKFGEFFKSLKHIKLKHGNFSINPKYAYEKDKAKCIGYYGTLNYKVKAKTAKDMNEFIKNFLDFKEKTNPKIKTKLSHIHWEIGKKPYQEAVENLRIEALLWANKYAKKLSATLKSTCRLKKAIFSKAPLYQSRNDVRVFAVKKFTSQVNTYLVKSKEDISINPNFTIECE